MLFVILGLVSVILFVIYDLNSVYNWHPVFKVCFTAGCAVIAVMTGIAVAGSVNAFGIPYGAAAVFVLLFLFLLIYSLFIELPFKTTYKDGKPKLYTEGTYALCRHPGVLWMILLMSSLALTFPAKDMFICAAVVCVADIIYIIIQDARIFPLTIDGYRE